MKGMQNTSLADTALRNQAEILIYCHVNSGFILIPRLVSPALGCFA
jgi:hypothetical protein